MSLQFFLVGALCIVGCFSFGLPAEPGYPHPYPQNEYPCVNPDPHPVEHPHPVPHPHPVEHPHPNPHPHPVEYHHPHPHPHPEPHPIEYHHALPHPHPVGYPHPDPHPVGYPHPEPHPVGYPHPDAYPYPHAHQHPVPHPHEPIIIPRPISLPPIVYSSVPYPVSADHDSAPPFPESFSFGVASGDYHIEGAWNQDGKGPNIWDHWLHSNPSVVVDGTNGDVASDAFNHLQEDVEILNNLTSRHYVFSISWARLYPSSCGELNQAGVEHYQRLLQLLRENQIEPIVVLYHGTLPQYLEDQGGFLSDLFPAWFLEYSKTVFDLFGHQVKYFITFNDPTAICNKGYGDGTAAPGVCEQPGVYEYICGRNLLKAHADVYHTYDDCYKPTQKGKVSIALRADWYEPNTDCSTDQEAAENMMQFQLGWWAHPIYIGDYPPAMKERIGRASELQGLCESRLPEFTKEEIEWIKDTHDFFSLNWFTSHRVSAAQEPSCTTPSYVNDIGAVLSPVSGDVTFGIRRTINWIANNYRNPSIFITETGFPSTCRDYNDQDRIDYIHDSLVNVRLAMLNDDARVYAYTYYSYIDGFEWTDGYTQKYGLYDVNFDCSTRTRTARKSAEYYQFVSKYGCIDDPCPPKPHKFLLQ